MRAMSKRVPQMGAPRSGMGCKAQGTAIPSGIASTCNAADGPDAGMRTLRGPGSALPRNTCITILAKAPVAGFAKTRLIPALGPEGAARVATQLLDHTVREAVAADLGEVRLLGAPDATHPAFQAHAARVHLGAQSGGDLGLRMHTALTEALAAHPLALLVGTDAPALDRELLRSAATALLRHDAVFVPALDGGYALIGLRGQSWPELFEGMTWSTARVMADTRARLQGLGLSWHELPAVSDIDEPADLVHVPAEWQA